MKNYSLLEATTYHLWALLFVLAYIAVVVGLACPT